jgi:ribosome-binding protein aMBF1 (putative translation factor)
VCCVRGRRPERGGQLSKGAKRGVPQVKGHTRSEVGSAVRAARLKNGWTLRVLGGKVGVQFTTLSKIENGHFYPGLDLLERIGRVTKTPNLRALRLCPTCGQAWKENGR